MGASAAATAQVNQQLKPEQLAKQMNQFQAETMKMDMTQGAFEDMFDELFEGESDEADSVINQVLDEIAIDTSATLSKLPTTSSSVAQPAKSTSKTVTPSSKATERH